MQEINEKNIEMKSMGSELRLGEDRHKQMLKMNESLK